MTTNLLYIGKSKSFLTQFGKLEDVQLIYAKDHKDAITICINLKARENIIILYEQGNLKEDVENITLFRKKFYQGYVVLVRRLKKRRKRCVSEKRNQRYNQSQYFKRRADSED